MLQLNNPTFIVMILAFFTGMCFGQAGKNFDHMVQETNWFKNLSSTKKWLVKLLLNVTHHLQYGLILMYIALVYCKGDLQYFLYYFGLALVIDDFPDLAKRIKKWWWIFQ